MIRKYVPYRPTLPLWSVGHAFVRQVTVWLGLSSAEVSPTWPNAQSANLLMATLLVRISLSLCIPSLCPNLSCLASSKVLSDDQRTTVWSPPYDCMLAIIHLYVGHRTIPPPCENQGNSTAHDITNSCLATASHLQAQKCRHYSVEE